MYSEEKLVVWNCGVKQINELLEKGKKSRIFHFNWNVNMYILYALM